MLCSWRQYRGRASASEARWPWVSFLAATLILRRTVAFLRAMVVVRTLLWLALSWAAYCMAQAVAEPQGVDALGWVIAALAVAIMVAPFRYLGDDVGERRALAAGRCLALAVGLALMGVVQSPLLSLAMALTACLATVGAGLALWELARTAPPLPRHRRRKVGRRNFSPLAYSLAAVSSLMGVVGWLSRWWTLPGVAAVPKWWSFAPVAGFLGLALAALIRRGRVATLHLHPRQRARNFWGLLGLVPVLVSIAVRWIVDAGAESMTSSVSAAWRVTAVSVGLWTVGTHVALLHPRWGWRANQVSRQIAAMLLVAGLPLFAAVMLTFWQGGDVEVAAWWAVGLLPLAWSLVGWMSNRLEPLWAPSGARLLRAARQAHRNLESVTSMEAIAVACLVPLRDAVGDSDAEARLYVVHPAIEVRVDGADQPRLRQRSMPEALRQRLLLRSSEILRLDAVEEAALQHIDERPLLLAMQEMQAQCVVPLTVDGELEGALVVPQELRCRRLGVEELQALESLSQRMASLVALAAGAERSRQHMANYAAAARESEQRLSTVEQTLWLSRQENQLLRAGPRAGEAATSWVAYSVAMMELERLLARVAVHEAPALLLGDTTVSVLALGRRLHEASSSAEGPWLVVDCAAFDGDDMEAAVFGDENRPGWLQLASGGSLFLAHFGCLPTPVQGRLAIALATRRVPNAAATKVVPLQTRLIFSSRVSLAELAAAKRLHADLRLWLEPAVLCIPPLADRREDLPSLALLALHRACRSLGRDLLGFQPAALKRLLDYSWPGDLEELQSIVDQAVRHAAGTHVEVGDLPNRLRRPRGSSPPPKMPSASIAAALHASVAERDHRVS